MHHSRHDSSHTQESEILLRHIDSHLIDVPQARKEEPREAADKQRRCERTTTASAAIGSSRGKHLGEEHQRDVYNKVFGMAIEQGAVEQLVPVGLRLAVEQQVDAVVSLAIE